MNGDVPVAWIVAAVLAMAGMVCYFMAASHLEDWNPFDFLMRGLPFEDLRPTGQALLILSWILGLAAAAVIVIDRFPAILP